MLTHQNAFRYAVAIALIGFHGIAFSHYYLKATVVANDSSRLTGFVEKISESKLSLRICFKENPDNPQYRVIPLENVKYVLFADDSLEYHRIEYARLFDSARVNEYRLARKMLGGYAELYKLQLQGDEVNIVYELNNTYAYIVKIGTNYYTLDQQERREGSRYSIRRGYHSKLTRILNDNGMSSKNIQRLKFFDKAIVPVIDGLNTTHPEIPRKKYFSTEKREYHNNVYLNIRMNSLEGIGGTGLEAGYYLNFNNPAINRKVFTQAGVSINHLRYVMSEDAQYSPIALKFPLSVLYYFNNGTVSPFIGMGAAIFVSNEFWSFSLKESFGCTLRNRFTIALNYEHIPLFPGMLYLHFGFNLTPN